MSIHPPIRQGQTRYPYIVMECLADDEVSLELAASEWVYGLFWSI